MEIWEPGQLIMTVLMLLLTSIITYKRKIFHKETPRLGTQKNPQITNVITEVRCASGFCVCVCVCVWCSLCEKSEISHFNFCIAIHKYIFAVVVQYFSHVQLFMTLWTAALQATLYLTIFRSLPKFMSIASMMPFSHLIFWCPLLLPSIFPSIRVFSNESAVYIRWPKYGSFSFSISPSNEYWNTYVYII